MLLTKSKMRMPRGLKVREEHPKINDLDAGPSAGLRADSEGQLSTNQLFQRQVEPEARPRAHPKHMQMLPSAGWEGQRAIRKLLISEETPEESRGGSSFVPRIQ